MSFNLANGSRRVAAVLSALILAIGLVGARTKWQQAERDWVLATTQPEGDPVVILGSGHGVMRFDSDTSPAEIKRRIDSPKALPGEGYLFDCAVEWLTAGTDEEKTGCKIVPIAGSVLQAAYVYQWPPSKGASSVLDSRKMVAEAESEGSLTAAVKRAVASARLEGSWPSQVRRPLLTMLSDRLAFTVAAAALPWLVYFVVAWIVRGFRGQE